MQTPDKLGEVSILNSSGIYYDASLKDKKVDAIEPTTAELLDILAEIIVEDYFSKIKK